MKAYPKSRGRGTAANCSSDQSPLPMPPWTTRMRPLMTAARGSQAKAWMGGGRRDGTVCPSDPHGGYPTAHCANSAVPQAFSEPSKNPMGPEITHGPLLQNPRLCELKLELLRRWFLFLMCFPIAGLEAETRTTANLMRLLKRLRTP